jgi:hypothetical protein
MNLRVGLLASLAVSLTLSSVFTTSSALCADAVDKSLVGIWEARFTAQGGICSKTWTIKPDGDSVIMDVPEHGGTHLVWPERLHFQMDDAYLPPLKDAKNKRHTTLSIPIT